MIIKSLYLKNIRSYVEQEITFDSGVSLLAGDIGTGKSTILLAIDFALFGLQRGELSGDAILRNGADYGVVTLVFSILDKEYKIQRILKKTGSKDEQAIVQDSGFLSLNGDIIKGTAIELKQRIINILNYPSESLSKKSLIYRYTVYTPQEEMKAILLGDANSRLETLRKLFNIDKYKRIVDNSRVVVTKLREKKKELSGKIFDLDEKKGKLSELNLKLESLKPELSNSEGIFRNLSEVVENKKRDISILEEKIKRLSELKKNKELSNYELNNKNESLNRLNKDLILIENELAIFGNVTYEDTTSLIELIKNLDSSIKQREEKLILSRKAIIENQSSKLNHEQFLTRLKNEFNILSTELVNFNDYIVEDLNLVNEKIKTFESELKIKDEELQSSRKIIIENETRKKHHEHLNNQILSLDNCPTCKQDVSVEHKISIQKEGMANISKLDENILKAKNFENEISVQIKSLKDSIELLKNKAREIELKTIQKKELEKKKIKYDSLANEINLAEKKLIDLINFKIDVDENIIISEIENLRIQLKDLEIRKSAKQEFDNKKLKKESLTNEIKLCEQKLLEINELKIKIDEEIQVLIDIESEFIIVKDEFEAYRRNLQDAELKVLTIKKDIEFINLQINSLVVEVDFKSKLRDKLDVFSKTYDFLDGEFLKMVEMMEKKVMSRVYFEFNDLFSRWLSILLNSEITNATLDSSFSPIVRQNGYDIDYVNLSGGEKTACALAYRLALNQVVNSIDSTINTKDLIILDEPTDGFSPEQLEILKEVLSQLKMKQIILVSHEPKIESFADHVIRVTKNSEHISKVNYI